MSTRLNTVTLQLGRQESEVWVNASLSDAARVQLSVGWANVLPGPLRTSPPRPIDLEIAIQNIEEHVMPLARMVPVGASLRISYVGDSVQSLRIPRQSGHRFHGKLDSDSAANWTPIPAQTGQLK